MTEYIDRENALHRIYQCTADCNPDHYNLKTREGYGDWMLRNGYNSGLTSAAIEIRQTPAVDLQPVVRCKECRHAQMTYDITNGSSCKYCDYFAYKDENGECDPQLYLDGNFFCAYGEKKD